MPEDESQDEEEIDTKPAKKKTPPPPTDKPNLKYVPGPEEEVERFFALLRRYGIKESVRTGRVAMSRGSVAVGAI